MSDLKIRPDDLTWLAKTWERLLSSYDYPTKAQSMSFLTEITWLFLRGQGKRIGNPRGYRKYLNESALLSSAIINRVLDDDAKQIFFPTLTKLGFIDGPSALELQTAVLQNRIAHSRDE